MIIKSCVKADKICFLKEEEAKLFITFFSYFAHAYKSKNNLI